MPSQIITTDDLIDEVRSMLDEDNRSTVSDTADILPALNRAQNYAANILARHYESPMLRWKTVEAVTGQDEYDIPENAFEQRLEKVEVKVNNLFYPVKRVDYRDVSLFETPSSTASVPYYYAVVNSRFRVLPKANATYPFRIWYLEEPPRLVKGQGRINIVNTAGNYVIVDSVGSDITTTSDNLNSYVNIIDAQTGKRKASYQIQNIAGNKITFKTSPTRTQVLNTSIDTSMVTANLLSNLDADNQGADVSIEADDFVCVIKGACVPFFKKPFSNFLVQYAIAEISRKLGGPADAERRVLADLEEQVERSWVGREQSLRVEKSSNHWNIPTRRYYGARS